MKFRIIATSEWSDADVIIKYPILEKYNYEYVDGKAYITINTLEELIDLFDMTKEELVILRHWNAHELTIEIYDTYRE